MSLPSRPLLVPSALRAIHGAPWAAAATDTALDLSARWSLHLGEPLTDSKRSLLLEAIGPDGTHVVLKVPATRAAGRAQAAGLGAFNGRVVTPLLQHDPDSGALLMPYVPDNGIPTTPAQVRTLVARNPRPGRQSRRMRTLTQRLEPSVGWARLRYDADPALNGAAADVDDACGVVGDLLGSYATPTLLHGDLREVNLRVNEAGDVTALAPRACVGDHLFDLATWAVTRVHHVTSLEATLNALSGGDRTVRRRLFAWAWCLAVLEPASVHGLAWSYQREFIAAFRHLSKPA